MFLFQQSRQPQGQALPEYVIIAALCLLVAIPALLLLGSNVSSVFSNMLGSSKQMVVANAASNDSASPAATSPNASLSPSLANPALEEATAAPPPTLAGSGLTITIPDGTAINLVNYPKDLSKSVQTVGANGTTELLAASIEQLAQQLLAEGKIDQAKYQSLIDLANQGHKIAEVERAYENVASQASNEYDYDRLLTAQSPLTGADDNDDYFVASIGFEGAWANEISNPLTQRGGGKETKKFQDLYQQALNSGAMNDPAVQKVVASLASQIVLLTAVVNDVSANIWNGDVQPDQERESTVSALTHVNSAGICDQGNGKDSGVQCSG